MKREKTHYFLDPTLGMFILLKVKNKLQFQRFGIKNPIKIGSFHFGPIVLIYWLVNELLFNKPFQTAIIELNVPSGSKDLLPLKQ